MTRLSPMVQQGHKRKGDTCFVCQHDASALSDTCAVLHRQRDACCKRHGEQHQREKGSSVWGGAADGPTFVMLLLC